LQHIPLNYITGDQLMHFVLLSALKSCRGGIVDLDLALMRRAYVKLEWPESNVFCKERIMMLFMRAGRGIAAVATMAILAVATVGMGATPSALSGNPRWENTTASATPAAAPAIDKVFPTGRNWLQTKGHSPQEAFDKLGDLTGVKFVPEKRGDGPGSWEEQPNVWQKHSYKNVDFDLDNVNYWQAAMQLADFAELEILGDIHMPTLQLLSVRRATSSVVVNPAKPTLVQDMRALRVMLFKGWESGWARFDLDFLLDPRLAVLDASPLQLEAATDAKGKQLEVQRLEVQAPPAPPQQRTPRGAIHYTMVSLSSGVKAQNAGFDNAPLEELRGCVPVVVATKMQSVEYALNSGELSNMEAQRVGDWSLKVTNSQAQTQRKGVSGPGPGPNHKFTLVIERLSDAAAPFPRAPAAIAHVAMPGNFASIYATTTPNGKTQEWSVELYSPMSKLIVHVPTEVKAAVLPFEFKKVPMGMN
jgi:hypothetical protein